MSWSDFWKSKNEKDYEDFLTSPKETYEKLQIKFQEMDTEITNLTIKNNIYKTTSDEKDKQISELYEELENAILKARKTEEFFTNKETAIVEEKDSFLRDLKETLKKEFELKVAQKEAELERDYHHQVHIYLEEEHEKNKENISLIIQETIKGLKDYLK